MPETEYLLYGTSVLQNYASAPFSNPNNILGPPDGTTIVYSGTNNAFIRVAYDASVIPDGVTLVSVRAGLLACCSSTSGSHTLDLCNSAGTKVVGTALFIPPLGSSPAAMGTTELPVGVGPLTKADLLPNNLRWLTAQSGSPNKRSEGDSMWLRVLTWDGAFQSTLVYPTSMVSSTFWTNPANAVGPPDGSYANTSSGATSSIVLKLPSLGIPANAKLYRVCLGSRHHVSSTARFITGTLSAGDTTLRNMPTNVASTWEDTEVDMLASAFTPAILNSGTLQLTVSTSSSATYNLDSVWLRAEWYDPTVAARAKRWSGSAWVDAPVKRWDGSQWVTPTVKRWDGSAWV